MTGAGFAKMAVEGLNGTDPVKECLPYLPGMKAVHGRYDHPRPPLTGYEGVCKERPRPRASGQDPESNIFEHAAGGDRRSGPGLLRTFVGKGGANVATAAKLLDITILIRKVEETAL